MTFYLTFNCLHPLEKGWIEIEADTVQSARNKTVRHFGRHWSTLYPPDKFDGEYKNFFPLGKLGETLR